MVNYHSLKNNLINWLIKSQYYRNKGKHNFILKYYLVCKNIFNLSLIDK